MVSFKIPQSVGQKQTLRIRPTTLLAMNQNQIRLGWKRDNLDLRIHIDADGFQQHFQRCADQTVPAGLRCTIIQKPLLLHFSLARGNLPQQCMNLKHMTVVGNNFYVQHVFDISPRHHVHFPFQGVSSTRDPVFATSNRRPATKSKTKDYSSPTGPHLLGLAIEDLAKLAKRPDDLQAKHRTQVAQRRISPVLEVEVQQAIRRTKIRSERRARPDKTNEPGKPALGCAAHSRRTDEARLQLGPIVSLQVYGQTQETSVTNLEDLPEKPRQSDRRHGFLHGAGHLFQGTLRPDFHKPRSQKNHSFQRHDQSDSILGRSTNS
ncbi:MAG: hypothetical protein H7833_08910 [Magnetococcus sp. DMHC-1]